MPFDNIGGRSVLDYEGHAAPFLYGVDIPDCSPRRV